MALYRVTVKNRRLCNGMCIEKGMSVEFATMLPVNPVTYNGGQLVVDAFKRVHGVDLKAMNAANAAFLDAVKIG